MRLKQFVIPIVVALPLVATSALSARAQASAPDRSLDAVADAQSLGARTRSEITRLGVHNADTDRALELQREGDRALQGHNPVKAAEDYGRAEEAVSVLDRERTGAREARDKTDAVLRRAKSGGADVAAAERFSTSGDEALETGNYHTAEVDYAEARAELSRSATR